MNDLTYADLAVGILACVGGMTLLFAAYSTLITVLAHVREAWEHRYVMHLHNYNDLVYRLGRDTPLHQMVSTLRDFIDNHNGESTWLVADESVARRFIEELQSSIHLGILDDSAFKTRLAEAGLTPEQVNLVCLCLSNAIHGEKVTK